MCVSWEVSRVVRAVFELQKAYKESQSDLDGWGLCSVKLRAYQLDGLSWLVQRHSDGNGCILGSVMKWDWERLCRFVTTNDYL